MYQYTFIYVVILLVLLLTDITKSEPVQCKRDRLITRSNSIVDWWVILKLSMGDLYLYYDSEMDDPVFKQGKFLRSQYSAFGQALKTIEVDADNYFGFNDDFGHQDKTQSGNPFGYFNHEKGMIAWNQESSMYIQHTIPKFPNGGSRYDISNFYTVDPQPNYNQDDPDDLEFLRFSLLGWDNNGGGGSRSIFDTNIMGDYRCDKTLTGAYPSRIQKVQKFLHNFGIPDDPHPQPQDTASVLKPASFVQHIFCMSMDINNLHELVNLFQNIMPTHQNGMPPKIPFVMKGGIANQNTFQYTEAFPKEQYFRQVILQNGHSEKKIYAMAKYKDGHQSNNNNNIWVDGLHTKNCDVEDITTQPCIPPDAASQLTISTFNLGNPNLNLFKYPKFTFAFQQGSKTQLFSWGAGYGAEADHCKVGFIEDEEHPSYKIWNICFSGSNLQQAKGSVMMCLKKDSLVEAFKALQQGARPSIEDWEVKIRSSGSSWTAKRSWDPLGAFAMYYEAHSPQAACNAVREVKNGFTVTPADFPTFEREQQTKYVAILEHYLWTRQANPTDQKILPIGQFLSDLNIQFVPRPVQRPQTLQVRKFPPIATTHHAPPQPLLKAGPPVNNLANQPPILKRRGPLQTPDQQPPPKKLRVVNEETKTEEPPIILRPKPTVDDLQLIEDEIDEFSAAVNDLKKQVYNGALFAKTLGNTDAEKFYSQQNTQINDLISRFHQEKHQQLVELNDLREFYDCQELDGTFYQNDLSIETETQQRPDEDNMDEEKSGTIITVYGKTSQKDIKDRCGNNDEK